MQEVNYPRGLTLDFDLDIYTGWKLDALKRVDCLVVWFNNVDETLVDTHFEVLTRSLVNVGSTDNGETMLVCGQWNWSTDFCICAKHCFNDHAGRLIDDVVIKCLEADTDAVSCHRSLVT